VKIRMKVTSMLMPRIKNRNGIGMRFWLLRVVRVVFPTLKMDFSPFELLRVVRVVAGSFPDLEKTYFLKTGRKFNQYIRYLMKVYTRMIYYWDA
jgi:DNA-binding helix-hairpin-helix protein with protein kinase domain